MGRIDELSEDQMGRLIGLADAARLLRGREGQPPNVATVRGWARPGEGYRPRGWAGEAVVLRTVVVGRDYLTLPEWVAEFERGRLRVGQLVRQRPAATPARKAQAMHRRAEAALDRAGVG